MFASKDLFFTRSSGYQISRSVRTRSSASAYFNRTFTTPTSTTIWTWSAWVKRGLLTGTYRLFGASTTTYLTFNSSDQLNLTLNGTSAATSTAVFRDPSAWYHIVYQQNGSAQTIYVNNVSVATGTTAASIFNTAISHQIAAANTTNFFDGYLTEINFIDGQALTPSSFGQTNSYGVWSPIKYTGTYGTNGFYLNFSDNSAATAAAIGKDYSGNGNNWTPNNISVTAGVTYDSMVDVPTPYADGSTGRGNYAVLNPINGSQGTVSNGNLTYASTGNATGLQTRIGTLAGLSTGKWYFEVTITAASASTGDPCIGWVNDSFLIASTNPDGSSTAWLVKWQFPSGSSIKQNGGTTATIFTGNTVGDVIMIAVDIDATKIWLGRNGTWSESGNPSAGTNAQFSNLSGGPFSPFVRGAGATSATSTLDANFGQRPFSYTQPTGFSALNTQNLSTPTIANGASYMAATTYTGTGSSLTIANTVNGISFYPDFVWVKGRSGATDHALYDSVRGTTKDLASNTTAAETTQATGLTAFGSTGFTVGALAKMNTNASTYVGWQWLAGAGSSSSNTSGSITSTVSVNATAGFSIVSYTATGSNATVGHGLGVAPSMIIIKNKASGTTNWPVYHVSTTAAGSTFLNATNAYAASATMFNSTAPTSTVFSVGSNANVAAGATIAYCFASVAGYSAFGSYTGNGSTDGPFVYLGFRPRWVMVKRTDSTSDWYIWDTSRDTYNVVANTLLADTSGAETSATSIDDLSNGFKCRSATVVNVSTGTYIYAAFAENPFKYSLAR
jgi:hypothetical protein